LDDSQDDVLDGICFQAMSPDGESIVTGAGDETLRFWNVFSKTRSTKVTSLNVIIQMTVK